MKESTLRSTVIETLRRHSAFAVENLCEDGTPDVCFTMGWIELKRTDHFPPGGRRLDVGFRRSQVLWHRRWRRRGGSSTVLTVVGAEWFVHDGLWAAEHFEQMTEQEFRDAAVAAWTTKPRDEILRRRLEDIHGKQAEKAADASTES